MRLLRDVPGGVTKSYSSGHGPFIFARLKVGGVHQADLRGSVGVGSQFAVEWVDIDDPERAHSPGTTDSLGVFRQGFVQGGASFSRLEGVSYNHKNKRVYFISTDGGDAGEGQVWEYYPRDEQLR